MYAPRSSERSSTEYGHYPVVEYGAEGDGATDDTEAIQSAIDDAIVAGGGIVSLAAGTYRVSSPLTLTNANNVVIEGVGNGSILYTDSPDGVILSIDSTRNDAGQSGSAPGQPRSSHNQIRHLAVDRSANPSKDSVGIHVRDAYATTIRGVSVFNQGRGVEIGVAGSDTNVPEDTQIVGCSFETGYNSAFDFFGYPDSCVKIHSSSDTSVHNTFIAGTNIGMEMTGNSRHVSISQCIFLHLAFDPGSDRDPRGNNIWARGNGYDRRIESSVFEGSPDENIKLGGTMSNFKLLNSWLGSGGGKGIAIGEDVSGVTLANNELGHQAEEGVLSQGDEVILAGNIMVDNVFANPGNSIDSVSFDGTTHAMAVYNKVWSNWEREGINVTGGSDAFLVTGNDFYEFWAGFDGGVYVNVDETGEEYDVDHNLTLAFPGARLSTANVSRGDDIVIPESTFDIEGNFVNFTDRDWKDIQIALDGPDGWEVDPKSKTSFDEIARDESASLEWSVNVPSTAKQGNYEFAVAATYVENGSTKTVVGESTIVSVPPAPPTSDKHLSDHEWVKGTTGWGEIGRDEAVNNSPITIGGETYEKGIGVHARSEILYYVGSNMSRFVADVGIDDAVGDRGNGEFVVVGDGEVLHKTEALTGADDVVSLDVDISGVDFLELIVTTGSDNKADWTWGNWAIAEVKK